MNNDFLKSILAGVVGTVAMTAMMMIAGKLGMSTMEPPMMLAETMGVAVPAGWGMHFMIGIVLAMMYVFLFRGMLSKFIGSTLVKGIAFGVIAFILAQVGFAVMGAIFPDMPEPQGDPVQMAIGGVVGHLLFGVVVAMVATNKATTTA